MHWCMDETLALLSVLPFIGYFFGKLHAWWHKKFHHACHEEGCHQEHVAHITKVATYDMIYVEDVKERYGSKVVEGLLGGTTGLVTCPEEFTWWVNDNGDLRAIAHARIFALNDACCGGW